MDLYCNLVLVFCSQYVVYVGDFDTTLQGVEESSVKYHFLFIKYLTLIH
jgi:hypothetical protein